ncbi:mitochondrial genome maintenance exonuclease 1 [Papilio machaon]|uniref:mitochondrial genome maintenance exonuclease 1 n=1 Tax=Papilio machaon TaxID=76193 RepID=UPI001E66331B|nr:mitochondrial genome maintenance exonuclease 1 [Papilio machaon]XP_045536974.1 mitochondrial genome maintenance exonuclease 1 [Papilio machaon]
MLRPDRIIVRVASVQTKLDFIRTKVVKSSSILNPAEKIKLYHKENKELFGPLLDRKKPKKTRLQKSTKNSQTSHQNNKPGVSSESTQKYSASEHVLRCLNYDRTFGIFKSNMWQNTKNCINYAAVLLNNNALRGIKTFAVSNTARSSAAETGYVSEDKILQIKPHQNDFAKQYPSVTLILNKTMTDDSRVALEKWKKERIAEMGLDEFNRFYEAQLALGTKFHSTLKNYFTQPRSQLRIDKDIEPVWVSVGEVLKNISSPKAIESNVVHPVLKYRGIFDAIADYEDRPTLIEWKKSDKLKKAISLTYDNPVQLAAYFGAVCNDLNYKHLNVRDALLVIAYTDGSKADVFHLSTDKLREHWAQWLIRLEEYTKKYSEDSEKLLKGGKRLFEEDIGNL